MDPKKSQLSDDAHKSSEENLIDIILEQNENIDEYSTTAAEQSNEQNKQQSNVQQCNEQHNRESTNSSNQPESNEHVNREADKSSKLEVLKDDDSDFKTPAVNLSLNSNRKVQFNDDDLINVNEQSDQQTDEVTTDQVIDDLISKQHKLNIFNKIISKPVKFLNGNHNNFKQLVDEQVYSTAPCPPPTKNKLISNSDQLNHFDTSNAANCKRRHSSYEKPKFSNQNYNTFSDDKYLQTSVPLTNSLPAKQHQQSSNNQQQPIWSRILNSFSNQQKGYEKIDSIDDHIKYLNDKNSKLNHHQNLDTSRPHQYHSHNSSFDNSSITNFFQTVLHSQRSLVTSMTANSALDLPPNKGPSRANSLSYLSSTGIQLKQNLGLINGVCIIVGVIVGSGIFISPKGVLESSHSVGLSLSIWICCGLLSLIGALCYAELGCAIPQSGGDYAYIRKAFGDLPAFLFLWVATLIIMPTGNAIAALTFANYCLVPYYKFVGCGQPPEQAVQLIAIILVCFLTFINCYNTRLSAFLMDAFTFAKVFALTIIIGVGFWQIVRGSTQNFENMWQGSSTSPQQIALSFYSGLFSYAGWNFLNFVTEELKDPFRTLPKAIYISLPLVTLIYVLANVAYFTVLTPDEIVNSSAVAIDFGDRILGVLSWSMPVFVVLSTFGGLNCSIFSSSRLFFTGARNGHLPRVLGQINVHYFTPVPSLLFLCLTTLVYLSTANVYILINYTAFNESLFITFSVAGLLWLRYKEPDLERPIKVNIILPILFFVICTFLVLLPVFEKPMETGISALITLSGIPVYLATVAWKKKPAIYNRINDSITKFLQVLLITVDEKKS